MLKNMVLILSVILLVACAPSANAVQTALAQTQAAAPTLTPTETIIPTVTEIPTATINPCSDRGWADITNYLSQYYVQEKSVAVGISKDVYLQGLNNYTDKINTVVIDSCTEHARQLVVSGLGNRIYAMQIILSGGNQNDAVSVGTKGILMIKDAEVELTGLGLHVTFP